MTIVQLRKAGASIVLTVPREVAEAYGWDGGEYVGVSFQEFTLVPKTTPNTQADEPDREAA